MMPDSTAQLRPRRSRCKTGCVCCRLRKKKCDEKRPVCASCSRLGLRCSWPSPTEFSWRIRMGLTGGSRIDSDNRRGGRRGGSGENEKDREQPVATPISNHLLPAPSSNLVPLGMLDTTSQRLLQLYVEYICPRLLSAPPGYPNPFLQDVLPLANSDTLIMNAVLALGGSKLSSSRNRQDDERVLECYGEAIRELKLQLTRWVEGSVTEERDCLRVFLTIILLCNFEIIRGNKKGFLFHHLRAGRHFAAVLYSSKRQSMHELTGVLLEMYAFFELSSSLRILPSQTDIDAALGSLVLRIDNLRHFNTFGVVLGGAPELFELIPQICQLAVKRKAEITEGVDLGCSLTFQRLDWTIAQWQPHSTPSFAISPVSDDQGPYEKGRAASGVTVQSALLLFLWSTFIQDKETLRAMAQPLVDRMVNVIPDLWQTPFINTTFWPFIVVASYCENAEQRVRILQFLPPGVPLLERAAEVLRWVWESPTGILGLRGLAGAIQLHQTSYCFA